MAIESLIVKIMGDSTSFKAAAGQAQRSLDAIGKSAKSLGASLSLKVTAPILALGAVSVKAAADFEVMDRKFKGAFAGVEESAQRSLNVLKTEFALSNVQATKLLASTGDMLKGFGASSEAALDLATRTNKLAAALSAYNGVPVAQASVAIKKALLGERESLKELDVVIRQADVDAALLAAGKHELTGQAKLLAVAEETLKLAFDQSSDAVNNFAKNQDTLSFQLNKAKAELADISKELGTVLLPIIKDVLTQVLELTKKFQGLSPETQKAIVFVSLFAAALGPVLFFAGSIVTAIGALIPLMVAIGGAVAVVSAPIWGLGLAFLGLSLAIHQAVTDFEQFKKTVGITAAKGIATSVFGGTASPIVGLAQGAIANRRSSPGSSSPSSSSTSNPITKKLDELKSIQQQQVDELRKSTIVSTPNLAGA